MTWYNTKLSKKKLFFLRKDHFLSHVDISGRVPSPSKSCKLWLKQILCHKAQLILIVLDVMDEITYSLSNIYTVPINVHTNKAQDQFISSDFNKWVRWWFLLYKFCFLSSECFLKSTIQQLMSNLSVFMTAALILSHPMS